MSDSLQPHICSLSGYSAHEISRQENKWVAIPFSRGSSWPRDETQVSYIAGRFFTFQATSEAQMYHVYTQFVLFKSFNGSVYTSYSSCKKIRYYRLPESYFSPQRLNVSSFRLFPMLYIICCLQKLQNTSSFVLYIPFLNLLFSLSLNVMSWGFYPVSIESCIPALFYTEVEDVYYLVVPWFILPFLMEEVLGCSLISELYKPCFLNPFLVVFMSRWWVLETRIAGLLDIHVLSVSLLPCCAL